MSPAASSTEPQGDQTSLQVQKSQVTRGKEVFHDISLDDVAEEERSAIWINM